MLLTVLSIIVAVLLIVVILLQISGSGLSSSFGGSGEFYRSKRSIEKILIFATIALSFTFAFLALLRLLPL